MEEQLTVKRKLKFLNLAEKVLLLEHDILFLEQG